MNRRERRIAQSNSAGTQKHGLDQRTLRDFREAVEHLQAGRLLQSDLAHRRVLERAPRHAPSLHHIGLIAFKSNARLDAVDYIRRSVEADPSYHEAWLNLAIILGDLKRIDEAIGACERCVALNTRNAAAYAVLGNLHRIAQSESAAAAAYTASLRLKPDQPDILVKLAEVLLQSGKLAEALTSCRNALALDRGFEAALRLERRILMATGEQAPIARVFEGDVAHTPAEGARRYDELGGLFREQGCLAEAVESYQKAVALEPSRSDWHFNLALAYGDLGRNQEALAAYQSGLAIEPDRAEAYASVGVLLRGMDMHDGAITALKHAVTLDPSLSMAHYNLAVTCKLVGRFEEALASFRRAVELSPDSIVNLFELCNLRRIICDWDGLDADEERCLDLFRKRSTGVAPFQLISMPAATRQDQYEAGRRHAKKMVVSEAARFKTYRTHAEGDRIRIGYLSSDFFEHATALLLVEVLEKADRERFEIFGYCHSPNDGSALERRIRSSFDHYVSIRSMSHHDAAQRIHADGIDILIDLKGYTRDGRLEILAYRPAPVQVSYLAYPATTGADFVDYMIADDMVAPIAHQAEYAERIVHLPHCYQPNDTQRAISSVEMTRAECGLPEDAFVFCSFNNSYKNNAAMFDIWMRLLLKQPDSVLWLLSPNDFCCANLKREAEKRGVAAERLVFAERRPIPEHLARHRLADLFLDSLPCNAHTTASDALWAGLPVLTCPGETFSGRVAASLLRAMNLSELVAGDLQAYEAAALAFARDKSLLVPIRQKISEQRLSSPLFDSGRYARNLERAYEMMFKIHQSGDQTRPFVVVEPEAL